jgi:hypothetical protein
MNYRLIACGVALWIVGTVALRFSGQYLLQPGDAKETLVLFAVSFPLMAWVVRRLCRKYEVRREDWPAAAIAIAMPTLLLDPFSTTFFPVVFPNMAPETAGVFAAWMLWCCAGALAGVTVWRRGS